MTTLKDLDKSYNNSIQAAIGQLEKTYQNIKSNYHFNLAKTEITEAIIERMKTYYLSQGRIKSLLDKRYLAPASDYFVESVLFFLNLYLHSQGQGLQAHSERQIKKVKNSIRPDISIWKQEEVVAIIECKTQLGWNRDNWEKQYKERNEKLKIGFPKAKSFLLVMSGINWGGFGNHRHLNKRYFCLLNDIWPIEYSKADQIFTHIEVLFNQLK